MSNKVQLLRKYDCGTMSNKGSLINEFYAAITSKIHYKNQKPFIIELITLAFCS